MGRNQYEALAEGVLLAMASSALFTMVVFVSTPRFAVGDTRFGIVPQTILLVASIGVACIYFRGPLFYRLTAGIGIAVLQYFVLRAASTGVYPWLITIPLVVAACALLLTSQSKRGRIAVLSVLIVILAGALVVAWPNAVFSLELLRALTSSVVVLPTALALWALGLWNRVGLATHYAPTRA